MEILTYGTPDEKAHISFRIVDLDEDSRISYEDFRLVVLRVLSMWYTITGSQVKLPDRTIRSLFNKLDVGRKGVINADEYVELLVHEEDIFDWFDILNNEYLHTNSCEEKKKCVDQKSISQINSQVTEMLEIIKSLDNHSLTACNSPVKEFMSQTTTKSGDTGGLKFFAMGEERLKTNSTFSKIAGKAMHSKFEKLVGFDQDSNKKQNKLPGNKEEGYDETTVRDEEDDHLESIRAIKTSHSLAMKYKCPKRISVENFEEAKDIIPLKEINDSMLLSDMAEAKKSELVDRLNAIKLQLSQLANPTLYSPNDCREEEQGLNRLERESREESVLYSKGKSWR